MPFYRALLFNGDKLRSLGEVIKNEALAKTLTEISINPHSFYNGSLAKRVVNDVQKNAKGILTLEDLKKYKVGRHSAIVNNNLGNLKLFAAQPPSSGSIVSLLLNILKGLCFPNFCKCNEHAQVRGTDA